MNLICMDSMVEILFPCRGSDFQYISGERMFWISEKNPYVGAPGASLKFVIKCYKLDKNPLEILCMGVFWPQDPLASPPPPRSSCNAIYACPRRV